MAARRSFFWPVITVIVALVVGLSAIPAQYRTWMPFFGNATLHYGLDLAGGTQLDFRISEQEILDQIENLKQEVEAIEESDGPPEQITSLRNQLLALQEQQRGVVEAIRTVLERRINALGVSEAVITPSYIGAEKHLLVECPGVVDTQKCIDTVGKTIQLEFKEEFTEQNDEHDGEVRQRVEVALSRITASGETLAVVGEDFGDDLGVSYNDETAYFYDQLPPSVQSLWNATPSGVQKIEGAVLVPQYDDAGQQTVQEVPGIFLAEVTKPRSVEMRTLTTPPEALKHLSETEENTTFTEHTDVSIEEGTLELRIASALQGMEVGDIRVARVDDATAGILFLKSFTPGQEEMAASHILISYEGALSASSEITRDKAEARVLAESLKQRIDAGEDFADLAREFSEGESSREGGSLGVFGRGIMVPAFEEASFVLSEGGVSNPVETQFGYHIIRADRAPYRTSDIVSFDELIVTGTDSADRATNLVKQYQNGQIAKEEEVAHIRSLFFSLLPTGWKDTQLDGKHFRAATVTLDQITNQPIVQITFDDEGGKLFQELTRENVGKRIAIFVGGQLVSAPTVQTEIAGGTAVITGSQNFDEAKQLATDLNTGAIPAPIYLTGQRTVEATLGAEALRTSMQAALIGIVLLMVYMVVMYRLLGLIADIALTSYAIIFLAVLKWPLFLFSSQYIVLTLAGMAGIILSIGMAVDANVLIFERIREELRQGKLFKTAADTGFKRAWPSIRDGNVSTFITCAILFTIGTSIVRGFAVTLGMGVLLSMFSAIIITRWLISRIANSPAANNTALFGVKQNQ